MNRNTLIVVHAYSGDRNQVEFMLPHHLRHNCPVAILSPKDGAIHGIDNKNVTCLTGGLKGWIGAHTLERQRIHLKLLVENFKQEYFLLNDADSICLDPHLPQYLYDNPDLFWSNEVVDTNPGDSLLPKLAFQPPYFVSRATILALLAVKTLPTSFYGPDKTPEGWPMPFPTGCIDHFMLQLVYGAKRQHFKFHTGASFETKTQHGLETMENLVRYHGKTLIHSVKEKHVLERLIKAHDAFKKNQA